MLALLKLRPVLTAAIKSRNRRRDQQAFPPSNYYSAQAATYTPTPGYPTPYLGLSARLSQTWINRWTILLLLVLVRTLLAIASLNDNLGSARKEALSACTSVENVGSAMASIPHYMADGVNDMTIKGVEKAINGLMEMLILTVTGVEEIIVFIINLLTQTYLCLITLAVSGSLHVAVEVAESVGNALNNTLKDIGKDLGGVESTFQSAMNGFMADVDKAVSVLSGKSLSPPTIDLSSEINKLNNLQIPAGYDQGLSKLNSSIPTFDQVNNFTQTAIRWPFEEVKTLLNESMPKYTMNHSLFPVPAKKQLSFCSDNDPINNFFNELVDIAYMVRKIFLVVVVILAVLAMVPMAYREYRGWMFMKNRSKLIVTTTRDPMDAVYLASRPYTSLVGLWFAKWFKSGRRQNLVRWTVAYATTVPALFVLSLALAGLLGCLCQYILLKAIEKEVPALTAEVGAFADKVIAELNNASESWANGANHAISGTNDIINDDILNWVNVTTTAVNNTLNVFVDDMVSTLNSTFGGTPLYTPILDVLNCLVLLKIKGIEKGLTWVSDHAHVDFPGLSPDVFSLGAASKVSGTESDILATGSSNKASNEIAKIVNHVTDMVAKAIRQETIISACLLIVWVIILLIGFIRALVLFGKGGGESDHLATDDPTPPGPFGPHITEKHEMQNIHTAAPPYEQAVLRSASSDGTYAQGTTKTLPFGHAANKLHGQAYTIAPAPVPTFEHTRPTSPILQVGFDPILSEKLGHVGGQPVDAAVRRPTHVRESSHGDYDLPSPISPRLPIPWTDPQQEKSNPLQTRVGKSSTLCRPSQTIDDAQRNIAGVLGLLDRIDSQSSRSVY
ncbi:hypothetical protein AMS68_003384 [Peltaster fructicola]|uniref:Plasma membrane fusion protein PRM1 n=1 Tax=Peltaster fructicola TaxID=286661 RepID=A0A6H0XSX7_9PEZI|nr:hypothetical protein AMS68_003384 [Peltaster fructicola]